MSIYGSPRDPLGDQFRWQALVTYLEAKVKAEKLNPEPDYDGIRENELLKEIARADLPYIMRHILVRLLETENE